MYLTHSAHVSPYPTPNPFILGSRPDLEKRYTIVDLWHMARHELEEVSECARIDIVYDLWEIAHPEADSETSETCPSYPDIIIYNSEVETIVAEGLKSLALEDFITEGELLAVFPNKIETISALKPNDVLSIV